MCVGQREDYDHWAALGIPGWGWKDLLPYFRKHQTIDEPGSHITTTYDKQFHGCSGPIHTSFPSFRSPVETAWVKACHSVLVASGHQCLTPKDAWSGEHKGIYSSLSVVDNVENKGTRSYATTGYLIPALGRPNLKVLTQSLVIRAKLKSEHGKVNAVGMEFVNDGKQYLVTASREIILCAGAIKTPQVLELSGIGNRSILTKAGITTLVENAEVGASLQDHVLSGIVYDLASGETRLMICMILPRRNRLSTSI
jgi:choline dehydrogenase-like flavoprotein